MDIRTGVNKITYKNNMKRDYNNKKKRNKNQVSVAFDVLRPEPDDDLSVTILACRVTILACRVVHLKKFSLQKCS
jgi:hypothetical protein